MDPNEDQDNAARTVVMLSLRGIVEDQLPGEPVNEVLRGLLPEHDVEDEAVNQVAKQVRRIAKDLEKDTLLQQSIDVLRKVCKDSFMKIVEKVIVDGITWEKVIVLLYIAGKFIVKLIKEHLQQSLSDILTWTWDFFKRRVLSWIEQQGGWVSSLSSFSTPAVQYWAIFVCGFLCLGFVLWRADRSS
ncbi:apoptosis regulator BAX-like [Paramormyrops kingsleyae]|uniref:Apoptosis regulator BAX-like n=1 Tax=Paramormyrops kingsleyae TaxID=1676925 RepID=A0A3B3Q5U5_9TELE|nr:apoptosis regulator BAX-like [Paramormyrops kingsleyae]